MRPVPSRYRLPETGAHHSRGRLSGGRFRRGRHGQYVTLLATCGRPCPERGWRHLPEASDLLCSGCWDREASRQVADLVHHVQCGMGRIRRRREIWPAALASLGDSINPAGVP